MGTIFCQRTAVVALKLRLAGELFSDKLYGTGLELLNSCQFGKRSNLEGKKLNLLQAILDRMCYFMGIKGNARL